MNDRPQNPADLVDALQDPIHREVGRSRPGRTARNQKHGGNKTMRSLEIRQICEDIKISVNTEDLNRVITEVNEALSKIGRGLANSEAMQSAVEALAQAERDRRWREDPLNLTPYLRFEGLRGKVADGLRAIADWIE